MKDLKHIDKIYKLLDLAMSDLEKVEKDSRYEVNMNSWHWKDQKCFVCLAGCVMAKTLNGDINDHLAPSSFSKDTESKLQAIDCFRCGLFGDMFKWFYGENDFVLNRLKYVKIISSLSDICDHSIKKMKVIINQLRDFNV